MIFRQKLCISLSLSLSLSLSCNVVAPGVQAAAARPRVEEEPTTQKEHKTQRKLYKFPSTKQTLKGTEKKQKTQNLTPTLELRGAATLISTHSSSTQMQNNSNSRRRRRREHTGKIIWEHESLKTSWVSPMRSFCLPLVVRARNHVEEPCFQKRNYEHWKFQCHEFS